jgi:hypothetical protein
VDERLVADGLLDGVRDHGLLTDRGFRSAASDCCRAAESNVPHLLAPSRRERAERSRPPAVEAFVAAFRNRIEGTNDTLKDRFHLERHRARRVNSHRPPQGAAVLAYLIRQERAKGLHGVRSG